MNPFTQWSQRLSAPGKSTMIQYEAPSRLGTHLFLYLFLPALVLGVVGWGGYRGMQFFQQREFSSERYEPMIADAAKQFRVDPLLVRAVIWQESRFNANALGSKEDIGLMQMVPAASVTDWARMMKLDCPSKAALLDPQLNIAIGTWYLGLQLRQFAENPKNIPLALAAYNAGPTKAGRWFSPEKGYRAGENPLPFIEYPATRNYVRSILIRYADYQRAANRPNLIEFHLGEMP